MFPSDWDIVNTIARREGTSTSAVIRRIVREWQRAQERAAAHTLVDTREGYTTEPAKQEG